MWRFLGFICGLAAIAAGIAWYVQHAGPWSGEIRPVVVRDDGWLDHLYSRNPREAEAAAEKVAKLGPEALPAIRAALQDWSADSSRRKAALKACSILGASAAPVLPDAATQLFDPDVTEQAAIALSFMGRDAFPPLKEALASDDAVVRREALRSIGKLKSRAPLVSAAVVPLLVDGMRDEDGGVRTVAATYLGIIHEDPDNAVPWLIAGLGDAVIEVRRASATALGSFGAAARPAEAALKQAATDADENLAREAGLALIRIQEGAAGAAAPAAQGRGMS